MLPALCSVCGIVILLAVIGFCLALILPEKYGYQLYTITSGSMAPEIPAGSLICAVSAAPEDIQPGDVIVFLKDGGPVAHRVMANRVIEGEFLTRGDANPQPDPAPIPYNALLGKVVYSARGLGQLMELYTGTAGKVCLLGLALCGVLLQVLSRRLRDPRTETDQL